MSSINTMYNNTIWALSNHASDLVKIQEQASTGQKINRPSDSPSTANRLLEIKSEIRGIETDISTISDINSRLEMSSSVIQNVTEQMSTLRARITNILSGVQAGDTADATRRSIAEEFNDVLEQFVSFANSKQAGFYLFSGADSSRPAYDVERDSNGDITQVMYVGSSDERKVEVASGVEMASCLVGKEIFRNDQRSAPEFLGTTGAVPGSGTSTIRGTAWLEVTEPTPGVFRLSIDDDPTNYVDIPPANGNTMLTNSKTGEILYVDTTAITSTGTEVVTVEGTYDLFNALISIRDVMRNENGLSEADVKHLIDGSVASLEAVNQGLTRAFTNIGGRIEALESLKNSIEDIQVGIEEERSRLQDADVAQLSVDLTEKTVLYQMSMSVASKVFGLSILDYI